ncbi:MAG: hypothetical protein LBV09_04090 [Deferribacteraceae bacterium]|jgi:hypothetical protein|nr:hypothetical protein [Deferribacteraceae bacterium]
MSEQFKQMIETARRGYSRYKPLFDNLSMAYLCEMNPDILNDLERRGKSHLFVPAVNAKVKRLHTAFMASYFTNDIFAVLSPDNPDDPQNAAAATAIERALRHYQRRKMINLYRVFDTAFLNVAVKGTCVIKAYWDSALAAPVVEELKLRDVWFDPEAKNHAELRYVVHRMYIPRAELETLRKLSSFRQDFELPQAKDSDQRLEIFDIYHKEGHDWYISTVLGSVTIRDRQPLADGLPLFIGTIMPQLTKEDETDAVEIYGDSPMAALTGLQMEMNILRNQQLDAIALQMNPKMLVQAGARISPYDLRKGPGTCIPTDNINSIRILEAPNVTQSEIGIEHNKLEMMEASGVTEYNAGTDSKVLNGTATGISILTDQANQRVAQMIRSLNETLVEPLFRHLALLIWRYGESRFYKDLANDRYIDPDLFIQINTGLGATSPQVHLNGLKVAFDMLMTPNITPAALGVLKHILPILGIKNTQEYINDDELQSKRTESGEADGASDGGATGAGGAAKDAD